MSNNQKYYIYVGQLRKEFADNDFIPIDNYDKQIWTLELKTTK